jgi:hypothetical protein
MKKKVVVIGAISLLGLLAIAFTWDCIRYVHRARLRVDLADAEMRKQEQRLLALIEGLPGAEPELASAIATYQAAAESADRQKAFDALLSTFRRVGPAEVDPEHPLNRQYMDDVAGAINRRDVARRQYDAEVEAFDNTLAGFRGRIGSLFSSPSRRADQ